MRFYLRFLLYAEQSAGKSNIVEVELGRLYDPLPEVAGMWLECETNVGGLQHAEPRLRCGHRD